MVEIEEKEKFADRRLRDQLSDIDEKAQQAETEAKDGYFLEKAAIQSLHFSIFSMVNYRLCVRALGSIGK